MSQTSEDILAEGGGRLKTLLEASREIMGSDMERVALLQRAFPGWSDARQYLFFKSLLGAGVRRVLMTGVYRGRDLSFLCDVALRYHPKTRFEFVGVDKFDAGPCADWPENKRGLSWEAAGFGPPPDIDFARRMLEHVRGINSIELIKGDAVEYMKNCGRFFDGVYHDTSHDFDTCSREFGAVSKVTHELSIISGDDYSNAGTWGVKRAVEQHFKAHRVLFDWVWVSSRPLLRTE